MSYLQAVSPPPTAGLLRPARTRSVRRALCGYSGPECSPGDHQFHVGARVRDPPFSRSSPLAPAPETHPFTLNPARARARAPHFSLRRGTYLPKCGSSAPPPPPGSGDKTKKGSHFRSLGAFFSKLGTQFRTLVAFFQRVVGTISITVGHRFFFYRGDHIKFRSLGHFSASGWGTRLKGALNFDHWGHFPQDF